MPEAPPIVADITPAAVDVALENVLVMALPVPVKVVFSKISFLLYYTFLAIKRKKKKAIT